MYANDPFDRVNITDQEGAQMIGPYDLALVRLTTDVTFIPEKLVPVWQQKTRYHRCLNHYYLAGLS